MKANILIINGPNLNLLGRREPEIYGAQTLDDIIQGLEVAFLDIGFSHFQSNHEGAIIDRIHEVLDQDCQGIIINPGAFSHYSYALHDALLIPDIPKIEVHISDISQRESWRQKSVTAAACDRTISGKGVKGYHLAVEGLLDLLIA